ncbi:MAG: hypothetical protein IT290_08680 [Deltaproteobacteria bacterium]|nr:hypothetical protein [Deltaproteobacteria bacterium]
MTQRIIVIALVVSAVVYLLRAGVLHFQRAARLERGCTSCSHSSDATNRPLLPEHVKRALR